MTDAKTKLSTTRRTMLRAVAYSEVTISYNGAAECSYDDANMGRIDGFGTNALNWLTMNGFIRCVGGQNGLGMREGLMRPTGRGELWLVENKVLG